MAAEDNLTTTQDLAALSVDFTDQFTDSVQKLLQALGNVRMHPMANGASIQTYKKAKNIAANKTVPEGEVIPLSKIQRTKDKLYTLALNDKLRRSTSFEAVQTDGLDQAINYTDQKLLNVAEQDAKKDLFAALGSKGTSTTNGADFQSALANGLGKLATVMEDYDGVGQSVAFVNPMDLYGALGSKQLNDVETQFGLQYIQNFLGVNTVIMSANVPQGKIYLTPDNNLNFYYVDMRGQAGQLFGMQVDQSGLIGVTHQENDARLTYDTIVAGGWLILPELTDGIVTSTIGSSNASASTPASK